MNLVFNVNDLKAKVIPNIQRDSKYLNLSYDALASVFIPSDFEYRSRLISLQKKIKEIESKNRQIENWVNVAIGNLKSAESNNTNAMNKLSSSISRLNLGLNSKANNTGGKTTTTSKVATSVKKSIDYAFSKKWILDASSIAKKTSSKVVSKIKSKISWALSTGAKIVNKAKSVVVEKVSDTLEFIGGKITSAWKCISEEAFIPLGNILKRTSASIANVAISFAKGGWQLTESLFDVIVMLGAGLASIYTGMWDGITYLASDNKEEWESTTSKMWKGTMGFVTEEHVENGYNAFFKKTIIGQWLDDNAYEWFKSDGVICSISSGLGYVAGIVILSIATAGIGTGAIAASTSTTSATSATIAALSGVGKYTQESWAAKRDSSWEGIERMYQKGEISEEQFNSYVMIREVTDTEWKEIEQDYKNGLISEEEYNAMKQIREMPDDWKTLENGLKGLIYGTLNGGWEGIQWYLGGKLTSWTLKRGSKVVTSLIRVGADTMFNAADTPFRTTIEALTSDKTWEEAWTEQGGLKSMLTDTIIGLIGSGGGEAFDGIKNARRIAKRTGLISDLMNVVNTGDVSDPRVINLMQNSFDDWLRKNNPYAKKLANKLIELKQTYPNLTWEIDADGGAFWSNSYKKICVGDNQVNWGDYGTFAHETGHLLFDLVLSGQVPADWDSVMANARVVSSRRNNSQLAKYLNDIKINSQINFAKAYSTFETSVKNYGYKSINDYVETLTKSIEGDLNTIGLHDTIRSLINAGYDSKIVQALYDPSITPKDVASMYVRTEIATIKESIGRLTDGGSESAISDIIDAVYHGEGLDLNGNKLELNFSHGKDYYQRADRAYVNNGFNKGFGERYFAFHEIIANFTQLKMSGKTEGLQKIRDIFGDEFYLRLEDIFNKLLE